MAPWNFKDQSWGETGKPPIIPTIAPIPLPYLCHEKPNKQGKSWAVSDAASPKDAIDCRQCNQCLWHRTSVADCLGPFLHDAREAARSILLQCSDFSFWKGRGMQEPCSSMFIHVHPITFIYIHQVWYRQVAIFSRKSWCSDVQLHAILLPGRSMGRSNANISLDVLPYSRARSLAAAASLPIMLIYRLRPKTRKMEMDCTHCMTQPLNIFDLTWLDCICLHIRWIQDFISCAAAMLAADNGCKWADFAAYCNTESFLLVNFFRSGCWWATRACNRQWQCSTGFGFKQLLLESKVVNHGESVCIVYAL